MPDKHAVLAPSAAKRWMTCAPSAKLESSMPEESSVYALEGTLAHATAEVLLKHYRDIGALAVDETETFMENWQTIDGLLAIATDCQKNGFDWPEMLEIVLDNYVRPVYGDYLQAKDENPEAALYVEAQLRLDQFIPEGFGSSDAVIIDGLRMDVYDLKYGRGVKVEAEHNPQMMCYALGALCGPGELELITTVSMTIIQPRLHHQSTWEITAEDLLAWGRIVLRPAAQLAWAGKGDYIPGDHCQFCKGAPRCKALARMATTMPVIAGDTAMMTDEELGEVLGKVDMVAKWCTKVKDEALAAIMGGRAVPGWKVVEGRSVRTIKDQTAAVKALQDAGFQPETYLKPQELRTISELEKVLRKAAFNELLGPLVVKPQGKPTLAPAADPKPDFKPESTENDFTNL